MYSYDRSTDAFRRLCAYLKRAMSLQDAEKILGVSATAPPDEINRAYKKKVFEHHPDRGGDPKKMVEINVAKEVLEGKRHPDRPGAPEPSTQPPRPKREKEVVTFEDAGRKAGVPMGFPVVFKTQSRYRSFDSESTNGGTMGYVAYGKTGSNHIFVGVEHWRREDMYSQEDSDIWSMRVYEFPVAQDLAKIAPGAIRKAFADFKFVRESFNAKVELMNDAPFNEKLASAIGHKSVSFKDAMAILGVVGKDSPWVKGRKVTVTLSISSDFQREDREIILDINGQDHHLGKDAYQAMEKAHILKAIFGDYYYDKSTKVITRSNKAKTVIDWMIANLSMGEEVKGLLQQALSQIKGASAETVAARFQERVQRH